MKDLVIVKSAHGGNWGIIEKHLATFPADQRAVCQKVVDLYKREDVASRSLIKALFVEGLGGTHYFVDSFTRFEADLLNEVLDTDSSYSRGLSCFIAKEGVSSIIDLLDIVKEDIDLLRFIRSSGTPVRFYETEVNPHEKSSAERDKVVYQKVSSQVGNRGLLFMGKAHTLDPFFNPKSHLGVVEITINPLEATSLRTHDGKEYAFYERAFYESLKRASLPLSYSIRTNLQRGDSYLEDVSHVAERVLREDFSLAPLSLSEILSSLGSRPNK